jgi:hypothetical protein
MEVKKKKELTGKVCRYTRMQRWRHAKEVVERLFGGVEHLGRAEFLGELFGSKDEPVLQGATLLELLYASYYAYNMYVDSKGLNKRLSSRQLISSAKELEEASLEFTERHFGKNAKKIIENSIDLEYDSFLVDTQPLREIGKASNKFDSLKFLIKRNAFMNANSPSAIAYLIAKESRLEPEPYMRLAFAYGQVQQIVNDFADIAFWVENPATREKTSEDLFADFTNGRYTALSHGLLLLGNHQIPKEILIAQREVDVKFVTANLQNIARNMLFHGVILKEWLKERGAYNKKVTKAFSSLVTLYQHNRYLKCGLFKEVRNDLRSTTQMNKWAENHYESVKKIFEAIDESYYLLKKRLNINKLE